jgi:hypothetical protein
MAIGRKIRRLNVSQEDDPDDVPTVITCDETAANDLLAEIDRKRPEKENALCKLYATDDLIFAKGMREQLEKASLSNGKFTEGNLRFLESIVVGLAPRNPREAMLAAQMAAIQKAISDQHLKLGLSPDDDDGIIANIKKLTSIFLQLLDKFEELRSKPGQQVVQHLMVVAGGQAIVGQVRQQQRDDDKAGATPPVLTHSSELPMQALAAVPKEVVKRGTRK